MFSSLLRSRSEAGFFNEQVSGGPDTCETNAQRVTRRGRRRDGRLRLLATVHVELVCYAYGTPSSPAPVLLEGHPLP